MKRQIEFVKSIDRIPRTVETDDNELNNEEIFSPLVVTSETSEEPSGTSEEQVVNEVDQHENLESNVKNSEIPWPTKSLGEKDAFLATIMRQKDDIVTANDEELHLTEPEMFDTVVSIPQVERKIEIPNETVVTSEETEETLVNNITEEPKETPITITSEEFQEEEMEEKYHEEKEEKEKEEEEEDEEEEEEEEVMSSMEKEKEEEKEEDLEPMEWGKKIVEEKIEFIMNVLKGKENNTTSVSYLSFILLKGGFESENIRDFLEDHKDLFTLSELGEVSLTKFALSYFKISEKKEDIGSRSFIKTMDMSILKDKFDSFEVDEIMGIDKKEITLNEEVLEKIKKIESPKRKKVSRKKKKVKKRKVKKRVKKIKTPKKNSMNNKTPSPKKGKRYYLRKEHIPMMENLLVITGKTTFDYLKGFFFKAYGWRVMNLKEFFKDYGSSFTVKRGKGKETNVQVSQEWLEATRNMKNK